LYFTSIKHTKYLIYRISAQYHQNNILTKDNTKTCLALSAVRVFDLHVTTVAINKLQYVPDPQDLYVVAGKVASLGTTLEPAELVVVVVEFVGWSNTSSSFNVKILIACRLVLICYTYKLILICYPNTMILICYPHRLCVVM